MQLEVLLLCIIAFGPPPPEFDPRTVQPLASSYTCWATPVHTRPNHSERRPLTSTQPQFSRHPEPYTIYSRNHYYDYVRAFSQNGKSVNVSTVPVLVTVLPYPSPWMLLDVQESLNLSRDVDLVGWFVVWSVDWLPSLQYIINISKISDRLHILPSNCTPLMYTNCTPLMYTNCTPLTCTYINRSIRFTLNFFTPFSSSGSLSRSSYLELCKVPGFLQYHHNKQHVPVYTSAWP